MAQLGDEPTAIQQIHDLAARGAHNLQIRAVEWNPRRYQAICLDCGWTSNRGTASEVDHAAIAHSESTLPGGPIIMDSPAVAAAEGVPVAEAEIEEIDPDKALENLSDEHRKLVPAYERFTSYVPRQQDGTTDYAALKLAALNGLHPILLQSDAGAGKNHLCEALGAELRAPYISISLNADAQTEDVVGGVAPSIKDGNQFWAWVDGYLTDFSRLAESGTRCIIVWDEINAAQPGLTFRLHQSTDHRRTLALIENHEVIVAGENLIHIATMNPDYRGTKPLNQALKRRFRYKMTLDYNTDVERKLLRAKGMTMTYVDKLLALAGKLRQMYHDTELSQPLGTADLLNYADCVRVLGESLARHSLLQNYDSDEREAVGEAMKLFIDASQTSASDLEGAF